MGSQDITRAPPGGAIYMYTGHNQWDKGFLWLHIKPIAQKAADYNY